MTFPFHLRWSGGQDSPSLLPVALATPAQRNPVPSWLPADSKTLYQQGLEALTTENALHNANPAHWLPAYCAHALHNFSEEHLSVLANPDTLASFNTEVVDPFLQSEPSRAQEYLQGPACFCWCRLQDCPPAPPCTTHWWPPRRRLHRQSQHRLPP